MNKTVWILWLQGIEQAPEIVRKCYESWVYHNSDWTVRVLSEDHIEELVPEVMKAVISKPEQAVTEPVSFWSSENLNSIWSNLCQNGSDFKEAVVNFVTNNVEKITVPIIINSLVFIFFSSK